MRMTLIKPFGYDIFTRGQRDKQSGYQRPDGIGGGQNSAACWNRAPKKIDLSLELGTTSAFDALNRDVYRIVDRYSITQGETVEVGARTHTGLSVGF